MYVYEAGVMERIEQTFGLLFSKKIILFILSTIVIFKVFTFIFFGVLETSSMKSIFGDSGNLSEENIASVLGSTGPVIFFLIYSIAFLVFALFNICLQLSLIKTIKDQLGDNNETTIGENTLYGIKNFWNSMVSYYHYFIYVFIIPSVWFIVGGIFLIFALQNGGKMTHGGGNSLLNYATIFLVVGAFVGGFIAVYRALQSCFFLVSAIDKDTFTKNNFQESVSVTKGNWWRIFGNFLVVGIIVGLCTSIFGGILSAVSFAGGGGSSKMETIMSLVTKPGATQDTSSIKEILKTFETSSFGTLEVTTGSLKQILEVLASSFTLTFSYLFFKTLEYEKVRIPKKEEGNSLETIL